jgi:hypothetical protein
MARSKIVRVLYESYDGMLTISISSQHLCISADYGQVFKGVKYKFESRWESALTWKKLECAIDFMLGKEYVRELEERHEEFLDELISYWEE